jgi:hypothetical protein
MHCAIDKQRFSPKHEVAIKLQLGARLWDAGDVLRTVPSSWALRWSEAQIANLQLHGQRLRRSGLQWCEQEACEVFVRVENFKVTAKLAAGALTGGAAYGIADQLSITPLEVPLTVP